MFVKTPAQDLLSNSSHLGTEELAPRVRLLSRWDNKMIVSTAELLSNFHQYFAKYLPVSVVEVETERM